MTSSAITVKLHTNTREREMYDNLADLYAIIKTTEALEKALLRDCIKQDEYKQTCAKLINQFKAAQNLTQIKTPSDIKKFMQDYRVCLRTNTYTRFVSASSTTFFFFFFFFFFFQQQLDCKAAFKRFEEGIPGAATAVDDSAKTIAETVQFFITTMVSFVANASRHTTNWS
jgi:hypothetical protein